jgi:hypothetical protein
MTSPAAVHIVELALRQTVLPEAEDTLSELRRAVAQLPAEAAAVIGSELVESARGLAGLLAHPDVGNSIVESLDRLSDGDLIVLRDYVLAWPAMCHGLKVAMSSIADDPDAATFAALAGLLSHYASALAIEGREMMLGFFIARTGAVASFLPAARAATRMRVGPVLREMAQRGLLNPITSTEEHEAALAAAGVPPEYWHYWLESPQRTTP